MSSGPSWGQWCSLRALSLGIGFLLDVWGKVGPLSFDEELNRQSSFSRLSRISLRYPILWLVGLYPPHHIC
ncbi:hypothetical protein BDV38DRAFT_243229 [Aspergillus pseudotamarii]|uniref:Uncharacterized protein n=1 Tax=Aspergillus pseudotamarii TaxID=132259 RepID=A0A5N6SYS0_ASPPS|nr:uncharacterized protein BDV38DRAFT_243229 [Aspergillus pseudotamarii]KAE8138921.1 hypothetical protein BDV38DRAFT_243229 [Aspergillus pseudotamarii]